MKNNNFRKKISQIEPLQKKLDGLIQQFFDEEPIIVGTLSLIYKTCGNPTCHCARGEGHPTWTLLTKYNGKRRCQVVRRNDVDEVKRKVEKYQSLKNALREIKLTDSQKHKVLRRHLVAKNELYK